jgi:pimeloyl-ACP methyl ester carboxylesterase
MSQMDIIANETASTDQVTYKSIEVDGLNIAYRQSGDPANPKLLLLHGFPASSHQYRNLIRVLADRFHAVAPDYPGFGNSDRPDRATFAYTFDKISEIVEDFLKLQGFDYYGLPKTEKPLIGFFGHDAIRGIYLHGAKRPDLISPDNWESDFGFMQRPDAVRLNLDLFSIGTLGNSLKQSPIKTGKRSRSS